MNLVIKQETPYYTVALKPRNEAIRFIGLYKNKEFAQKSAKHLRDGWKKSRLRKYAPTSIRVRKITSEEFWAHNGT